MRSLIRFLFAVLVWIAYRAFRAEGINALLLLMPAKLIAPTLRRYGAQIGERVEIHSPLIIHNASEKTANHYANLVIGNDCYFGRDVFFDLRDEILIEDQVTISMRVTFVTHTDVGKSPVAKRIPPTHAPILVRRGVYVGAGATILEGVEIGEQAVVGAGAVVIENVPAHATVAGVPARLIKEFGDRKI